MTKHTFKIGNNRGRSRIWLDGKHLTDAGFVPGTKFIATSSAFNAHWNNTLVLHFSPVNPVTDDEELQIGQQVRKVSGRPTGKPIIDIVGKTVSDLFPGATHIDVEFGDCRIVIKRAAQ